ncbi:hypothetical protein CNR37_00170 [Pseudomonas phage ventosus]|uniref:Uncharacterized protein n=1 Tax=Pseudomonas phage ventosus TaxID=2048980 RepID=A0A2H4P880_9CAUD|nr:hypothetical protein CNR37_00170 [Pseudomonas phage ventosus]
MARSKKVKEATTVASEYPKVFDNGITIESVSSTAKFLKSGDIDLTVKFSHLETEVPFTATATDPMEHGRWLYEQALAGKYGVVAEYERPLPTLLDLQEELDKIWPDVVLGIATEDELSLAKALRLQIKAMS